jgi:hypothetical protein
MDSNDLADLLRPARASFDRRLNCGDVTTHNRGDEAAAGRTLQP